MNRKGEAAMMNLCQLRAFLDAASGPPQEANG
jgi:hypothetical protein